MGKLIFFGKDIFFNQKYFFQEKFVFLIFLSQKHAFFNKNSFSRVLIQKDGQKLKIYQQLFFLSFPPCKNWNMELKIEVTSFCILRTFTTTIVCFEKYNGDVVLRNIMGTMLSCSQRTQYNINNFFLKVENG